MRPDSQLTHPLRDIAGGFGTGLPLGHADDGTQSFSRRRDLFAYIEGFYNSYRLHSTPGYLSSAEMELAAA